MTIEEFSNSFDTLLNSYNTKAIQGEQDSKAEIVLDEYEKSILLTQAQDIVVKSYFDKTLNPQNQGFDDSARRQVDFSSLIKIADLEPVTYPEDHSTVTTVWSDGNGFLGNVTIKNKTSDDLQVTLDVNPAFEMQSHGVEPLLEGAHLTIVINPTDLDVEYDMPNLAEHIMTSWFNGINKQVKDFIDFIIDNPTAGEYPSDEGYYNLIDTVLGPKQDIHIMPTFDDNGVIFKMPSKEVTHVDGSKDNISDVLFILNEKMITPDENYVIIPINYSEYDREKSKPYGQPLKKQAWRLFQNNVIGFDIYSELIPRFDVDKDNITYRVRYVKRPNPIVLVDLKDSDGPYMEIDGFSDATPCELNPILHMDILNKAVELAIATRGTRTKN